MCTIGAKILQPGREFVLFKNRDFTRDHFDDRVAVSADYFGARGLETWDKDGSGEDRFSGFSIGLNRFLACCDSNVQSVSGGENYDKLVQAVVENCATIEESQCCVRQMVNQTLFHRANLLVGTPHAVAAFEIRGRHVEVEHRRSFVVRANHHVCLGQAKDDDDVTTTAFRYQAAYAALQRVSKLEDVFELLSLHGSDEWGICNHSLYKTVYSYVIHWRDDQFTFYVHQGYPCDGRDYVKIPMQFGAANDLLSVYPSAYYY